MNGEILRLVDTLHRDKDIDKEIIFQGVEACILSAVRKKLGESEEIRVAIDRESGETTVFEGEEKIPISDLGRLAALQGKQVLFQKIREAERDKTFAEYEHRIGKLVTGVVQRAEGPNLIINLGNGKVEGILPRGDQAPGERFRVGERIKVLVRDVKKNHRVKITLSRSSPDFVRALFELEVPEIAERVIEIMDIVREPGYRTKIAVTTYDHNVDCVGACVGVRGSRIKNIVDELFGEKIDIVRWNESIEVLIMNALKPAEITTMDLDYENSRATVYVRPDQQSLAIGKRGQNVRLASKLAKWELDIVMVSEEDIERLRKGETPVKGGDAAGVPSAAADMESPRTDAVDATAEEIGMEEPGPEEGLLEATEDFEVEAPAAPFDEDDEDEALEDERLGDEPLENEPLENEADESVESRTPENSLANDETAEAVSSPLRRPDAGSSVKRQVVDEPEGTGSLKPGGGAVDSRSDSLP